MTRSRDRQAPDKILISRRDAAVMLGGISTQSLIRLEKVGRLQGIRLDPRKKRSPVFYRPRDLLALTKSIAKVAK